jgi:hypothetical protein
LLGQKETRPEGRVDGRGNGFYYYRLRKLCYASLLQALFLFRQRFFNALPDIVQVACQFFGKAELI